MNLSSDDFDRAVMSTASPHWQKVAMVIVRSLKASNLGEADEKSCQCVASRIEALVRSGKLEAQGTVTDWRYSEVRLPQAATWFFVEQLDRYSIIQITSTDGINRLALEAVARLGTLLSELACDEQPLIITGNEKFFSVGADLNEMAAHDSVSGYRFSRLGQAVMDQLDHFPALTIAAINGNCFGGAIDMALACDLRICAPNAIFGHRGAALGLITGWGGTQRLPRLIGKARALQMFCAAEKLDAKEALRIGLVNEVADDPVATAMTKYKMQIERN